MKEPRIEYNSNTEGKTVPEVYAANGELVHKGERYDNRSNAKRSLMDLKDTLDNLAARGQL